LPSATSIATGLRVITWPAEEAGATAHRSVRSGTAAEDDEFWNARADKRYATLMGVDDVRALPAVAVSNVTCADGRCCAAGCSHRQPIS
jgi:hypothetical protein